MYIFQKINKISHGIQLNLFLTGNYFYRVSFISEPIPTSAAKENQIYLGLKILVKTKELVLGIKFWN